jgi:hypothetical protein
MAELEEEWWWDAGASAYVARVKAVVGGGPSELSVNEGEAADGTVGGDHRCFVLKRSSPLDHRCKAEISVSHMCTDS